MSKFEALLSAPLHPGRIEWIGLRPARRAALRIVSEAEAIAGGGLRGDRYPEGGTGKRGVTLIQAEHLAAIGAFLGRDAVDPALLRRNLVVVGLNLLALKNRRFRAGEALLEATGDCAPCAHMEEALGVGGFQAMRGHGGITARVLEGGWIRLGDTLELLPLEEPTAVTGEADSAT